MSALVSANFPSRLASFIPWLLTALLAFAFALTLIHHHVYSSLVTSFPAGFAKGKTWLSVSRGEPTALLGLKKFSRRQVEEIQSAFPDLQIIAASGAAKTEIMVDGQRMEAWIEFVSPHAFVDSGIDVHGYAASKVDDYFCIPSERWHDALGKVPKQIGVDDGELVLVGSVTPRFRLFAGVSQADMWCSWNGSEGVLVPRAEAAQASDLPLYAVFVGSSDPLALVEWRERTRAIDLPMTLSRGREMATLISIKGWVTSPSVQRDAIQRASLLGLIFAGFLLFSIGLVLFVSFARVRHASVSLKVRYALGARRFGLLLPSILLHIRSLFAALLAGSLLAMVLAKALWHDPVLANAKISAEPLFGSGMLPALAVASGLTLLSLVVDSGFILKYAHTSRLDLSPREAMSGLRTARLPAALMACFMFIASWAAIAQVSNLRAPHPSAFGVNDDVFLAQLRFKPGTWVSERTIPRETILDVAREFSVEGADVAIAAVESIPGYAVSLDVGDIRREDGVVCSDASDILRSTETLLDVLKVPLVTGRPPTLSDEMAMSVARAETCFGSVDRALGSPLLVNGRKVTIVGVYRDFNWHLGRSGTSGFLASLPDPALNLSFVTSTDLSPDHIKSLVFNNLHGVQPNLREVVVDSLPTIAAALYESDTAQARQLAILATLMALACIATSSAFFASIFRDRRPLVALYVATGATNDVLGRTCLLPFTFIALCACFAISLMGLLIPEGIPDHIFRGDYLAAAFAALFTIVGITLIAAGHLFSVVRQRDLMRELKAF